MYIKLLLLIVIIMTIQWITFTKWFIVDQHNIDDNHVQNYVLTFHRLRFCARTTPFFHLLITHWSAIPNILRPFYSKVKSYIFFRFLEGVKNNLEMLFGIYFVFLIEAQKRGLISGKLPKKKTKILVCRLCNIYTCVR